MYYTKYSNSEISFFTPARDLLPEVSSGPHSEKVAHPCSRVSKLFIIHFSKVSVMELSDVTNQFVVHI